MSVSIIAVIGVVGRVGSVSDGMGIVKPGDMIIVIISREGTAGYSADLAIARIHGILNIKPTEAENNGN